MEKFGSSVTPGRAALPIFVLAAHTPDNAAQHKQWANEYHWDASHDWEFPMLPNRFVESSCVKCHHEITDLVRQGNKEEAPKLQRGFDLVRENGCFGCHEISRALRPGDRPRPSAGPSPALAWHRRPAKSDPLNPPGTYRKVGPSLRRIAEKTNEKWARRQVQSPRGTRPDTKMPLLQPQHQQRRRAARRPERFPRRGNPLHRPLHFCGKPGQPRRQGHIPR